MEDGTDDFTIGIPARCGDSHYSIMIYTRYLDEPPEPKEMYPTECCAVGALQIFSPEPSLRETLEVWNSGALDGLSQRQVGATVCFVRGISDGDKQSLLA